MLVNLLAPNLKAEILLTIAEDGEPRIYYSKVASINDLGQIAACLVDSGMKLAAEYGITLTIGHGGQRIELAPPRVPPSAVTPPPEVPGA